MKQQAQKRNLDKRRSLEDITTLRSQVRLLKQENLEQKTIILSLQSKVYDLSAAADEADGDTPRGVISENSRNSISNISDLSSPNLVDCVSLTPRLFRYVFPGLKVLATSSGGEWFPAVLKGIPQNIAGSFEVVFGDTEEKTSVSTSSLRVTRTGVEQMIGKLKDASRRQSTQKTNDVLVQLAQERQRNESLLSLVKQNETDIKQAQEELNHMRDSQHGVSLLSEEVFVDREADLLIEIKNLREELEKQKENSVAQQDRASHLQRMATSASYQQLPGSNVESTSMADLLVRKDEELKTMRSQLLQLTSDLKAARETVSELTDIQERSVEEEHDLRSEVEALKSKVLLLEGSAVKQDNLIRHVRNRSTVDADVSELVRDIQSHLHGVRGSVTSSPSPSGISVTPPPSSNSGVASPSSHDDSPSSKVVELEAKYAELLQKYRKQGNVLAALEKDYEAMEAFNAGQRRSLEPLITEKDEDGEEEEDEEEDKDLSTPAAPQKSASMGRLSPRSAHVNRKKSDQQIVLSNTDAEGHCMICSCQEFYPNRFRKTLCGNCSHNLSSHSRSYVIQLK